MPTTRSRREAGHAPREVRHLVERVGDHDQDRERRAGGRRADAGLARPRRSSRSRSRRLMPGLARAAGRHHDHVGVRRQPRSPWCRRAGWRSARSAPTGRGRARGPRPGPARRRPAPPRGTRPAARCAWPSSRRRCRRR